MNRIAFVAALAAVACTGDTKSDSGTPDGGGPAVIQNYNVTCANDTVTFTAGVTGTPYDGLVYSQETASEYQSGGALLQYSDEHDLSNNGANDGLEASIQAGVTYGTQERNVGTIFACDRHYNETAADGSPFMTYAFGVYDDAGAITDCLAGGNDAPGLIAGDYAAAAVNAPSAEFDLSACVAAQSAR